MAAKFKGRDVAAVDRKKMLQPNVFYGCFLVHPAKGRLMRWVLDGRGRRMWKGLGNVMGKLGQGCRWADFTGFFLEA